MKLEYKQDQASVLVNKKYDNHIQVVSQTKKGIQHLYGSGENGFHYVLARKMPITVTDPGTVVQAMDSSSTGVTVACKTKGSLPRPTNRSSQNICLTPASETDIKETLKDSLWDDTGAAGYTTPAVARMNTEDPKTKTNTVQTSAVQTFTVFEKKFLSEVMVATDGSNEPLQKSNIIANPKEALSRYPATSPEFQENYKALVGLEQEALVRAARAFPDKTSDDFQFLCTYVATNDSYSLQALRDAIDCANETLGAGFLQEGVNVTLMPEYRAAQRYYQKHGLPDGSTSGKYLCTIDIGSFSTDFSLTLDDTVKNFSIPYAGKIITTESWKEMCLYDIETAETIFQLDNDPEKTMLVEGAKAYVEKMKKLSSDPNQSINNMDILESPTLDAYWELLSPYINQKKINARLFTLLCRTKLSALLWILEQEIGKSLNSVSILPGETLNIVFLGRGSYVFHNLKNANSELLSAWAKRITDKFDIAVKAQIANSTDKIQLVHGMLSFPQTGNHMPDIPAIHMPIVEDRNRFEYYAHTLGTDQAVQLLDAVNSKAGNYRMAAQAKDKLCDLMFYKIHNGYSFEDFRHDLDACHMEENRLNPDSYMTKNNETAYLSDDLAAEDSLFNEAKTIMAVNISEDIRRFVLSVTGLEKELYFLKMVELMTKLLYSK